MFLPLVEEKSLSLALSAFSKISETLGSFSS
jgi:hypothetical protein